MYEYVYILTVLSITGSIASHCGLPVCMSVYARCFLLLESHGLHISNANIRKFRHLVCPHTSYILFFFCILRSHLFIIIIVIVISFVFCFLFFTGKAVIT